ncbi:MAG TPA: 3-methyl-2-oxobutanoate dehydrogenase subunit beta, partial [Ignavibacteriaceae bacterium]
KVILPEEGSLKKIEKPWATTGKPKERDHNIITSLFIKPEEMEDVNHQLQAKYKKIQSEVRFEEIQTKDAEILLVAFGLSSRICQKTVDLGREKGIKIGLLRPITLYPYPYKRLNELADQVDFMMSVEMNAGQMVEDVRLAVEGKVPVHFTGRMGGMIPSPDDVLLEIEAIIEKQNVLQD